MFDCPRDEVPDLVMAPSERWAPTLEAWLLDRPELWSAGPEVQGEMYAEAMRLR